MRLRTQYKNEERERAPSGRCTRDCWNRREGQGIRMENVLSKNYKYENEEREGAPPGRCTRDCQNRREGHRTKMENVLRKNTFDHSAREYEREITRATEGSGAGKNGVYAQVQAEEQNKARERRQQEMTYRETKRPKCCAQVRAYEREH